MSGTLCGQRGRRPWAGKWSRWKSGGVVFLDEVEGGLFGKRLRGAVGGGAVGGFGRLVADGVLVGFRVGVFGLVAFGRVDYGGEGGGDDDAVGGGGVGGDGAEDLGRAVDGGVEEVALVVLDGHLEGGGGVDDLVGWG